MKVLASCIGAMTLIVGIVIVSARQGAWETDPTEAQALYGAPPSQFLDVDGTRLHYRDEGQGPVLVLLHGSRGSLHQWDGWVRELGAKFRIVRVDAMAHGLSGADGRDDYSTERRHFLLNSLLAHLQVERFILGGTSSGASEAVRYTVANPGRVEKLLLSTIPLRLPAQARTSRSDRAVFWFHDHILGTLATDWYWRRFLRSVYGDPDKVSPELAHRYRMLNSLPGQQQRFLRRLAIWRSDNVAEGDFKRAAQITVPTFIQWGGAGPVLPREMFCEISSAFTQTAAQVKVYPQLGHMLVMEDPVQTARDALAFIDGSTVGSACSARSAASVAPVSR